jgi:hypothetical protein
MRLLLIIVSAGLRVAGASEPTCEAKCVVAGHCCPGAGSSCQKPSCAMGCIAGAHAKTEAACNASCTAAGPKKGGGSNCNWPLPGTNITFAMCGSCVTEPAPKWWPKAAVPPNGSPPGYWPPGYSLKQCGSCETIDGDGAGECKLGCMFTFRPDLKPVPPAKPQPPPARPAPPACGPFPSATKGSLNPWSGCTVGATLNFSSVFSDNMVLQMQPAKAAVYGTLGSGATSGAEVTVSVSASGGGGGAKAVQQQYSVAAEVDAAAGTWKVFLKPHAAGGSYTVTARCTKGCTGSVQLEKVHFGDVWYCFGQSNMALPFQYTYARNATIAKIKAGKLANVYVTGLKGNMNADQPWISLADAVVSSPASSATNSDSTAAPAYGAIALDHFSSTCLCRLRVIRVSVSRSGRCGLTEIYLRFRVQRY